MHFADLQALEELAAVWQQRLDEKSASLDDARVAMEELSKDSEV